VTIVDILGTASSDAVAERAKELMQEDEELTAEEAIGMAEEEIAEELEAEQLLAEAEAERADELDEDRMFRRSVRVERADVDVEWQDDLRVGGGVMVAPKIPAANRATEAQINYLVRLGVKRETAMTYSKRQASAVISKLKDRKGAAV